MNKSNTMDSKIGGDYAELTFGETHYFMFGPEDGMKVDGKTTIIKHGERLHLPNEA